MLKVGINGFGRIGRLAARIILKKFKDKIDLVCINTSGRIDTTGWTHLFKYDTAYGKYQGEVSSSGRKGDQMVVDGKIIPVLGERVIEKIPWSKYKVQVVIESTGVFREAKEAEKHLRGTVKKVVLSAPGKPSSDGAGKNNIPMYIIGVNEDKMGEEKIISCASCTTNCVAPVTKVIDQNFGIVKAFMSTIHAYTPDQRLLDGSHKDLRRARSAAVNIIPTTTGAARATGEVYSPVKGIFDGLAIRVPVMTGSLVDFSFVVKKKTTVEQVNQAFEKASKGKLKGILGTTYEAVVSSDVIGFISVDIGLTILLTSFISIELMLFIIWFIFSFVDSTFVILSSKLDPIELISEVELVVNVFIELSKELTKLLKVDNVKLFSSSISSISSFISEIFDELKVFKFAFKLLIFVFMSDKLVDTCNIDEESSDNFVLASFKEFNNVFVNAVLSSVDLVDIFEDILFRINQTMLTLVLST